MDGWMDGWMVCSRWGLQGVDWMEEMLLLSAGVMSDRGETASNLLTRVGFGHKLISLEAIAVLYLASTRSYSIVCAGGVEAPQLPPVVGVPSVESHGTVVKSTLGSILAVSSCPVLITSLTL